MLKYSKEAKNILDIIECATVHNYSKLTLVSDLSDYIEEIINDAEERYREKMGDYGY